MKKNFIGGNSLGEKRRDEVEIFFGEMQNNFVFFQEGQDCASKFRRMLFEYMGNVFWIKYSIFYKTMLEGDHGSHDGSEPLRIYHHKIIQSAHRIVKVRDSTSGCQKLSN